MFCQNCGHPVHDEDKYCEHCGYPLNEDLSSYRIQQNYTRETVVDSGSFWWGVLACFIPLVGYIMFFIYRKDKPKTARVLLIGAIIGTVINIIYLLIDPSYFIPSVPNDPSIPDFPHHGGNF